MGGTTAIRSNNQSTQPLSMPTGAVNQLLGNPVKGSQFAYFALSGQTKQSKRVAYWNKRHGVSDYWFTF